MDQKILDYVWNKQKDFNRNFVDYENLTNKQQQELTKDYSLHLMSEVLSLLEEVNWKMHHKDDAVQVNRRELILEWIDVFKYWLSIGLIWDITPEEMVDYFAEKSDLVEQRYLQEFSNIEGKDIVICDIDGVIGDYPLTFMNYVRDQEISKGKEPLENKISLTQIDQLDLYKYLEGIISTEDLKEYKVSYRESGEIRKEKVVEGAKQFLQSLKDKGYYIVLLTSRPFDMYKNLYLDTYVWLKQNGLPFDMLLNDSKKRDKIVKLASVSNIKFIVDDDPKIIKGLLGLDKISKIYLIDKLYNQSNCDDEKVTRVKSFDDILNNEGVS